MFVIFCSSIEEYHILRDKSSDNAKERPWAEKKAKSISVASSYRRLGDKSKYNRVYNCGNYLEFKRFADSSLKLHTANFCKVRLCPLCAWRRSLKIFGQISKIMDEATKDKKRAYIFLTLTVRNCSAEELPQVLDMMMSGYKLLFDRRKIKKSVLGAFRALEITHNTNRFSTSYNTYHPHFHVILMVNKSYFNAHSDDYITQSEWTEYWGDSIRADYQPIIHVEKIKDTHKNIQKAVAETAKYTVKDADYLNSDESLQDEAISVLDGALATRRLVSFRGEFAKIRKQLNLDDAVDGDLINCDGEEELRPDLDYVIEVYKWHIGYNNYLKLTKDYQEFERVGE